MNLGDVCHYDIGSDRGPLVVRVISAPREEDPQVTRAIARAAGHEWHRDARPPMVVDVETAWYDADGGYWATNDVRTARVFDLRESAQRYGAVPEKSVPRRAGRILINGRP